MTPCVFEMVQTQTALQQQPPVADLSPLTPERSLYGRPAGVFAPDSAGRPAPQGWVRDVPPWLVSPSTVSPCSTVAFSVPHAVAAPAVTLPLCAAVARPCGTTAPQRLLAACRPLSPWLRLYAAPCAACRSCRVIARFVATCPPWRRRAVGTSGCHRARHFVPCATTPPASARPSCAPAPLRQLGARRTAHHSLPAIAASPTLAPADLLCSSASPSLPLCSPAADLLLPTVVAALSVVPYTSSAVGAPHLRPAAVRRVLFIHPGAAILHLSLQHAVATAKPNRHHRCHAAHLTLRHSTTSLLVVYTTLRRRMTAYAFWPLRGQKRLPPQLR